MINRVDSFKSDVSIKTEHMPKKSVATKNEQNSKNEKVEVKNTIPKGIDIKKATKYSRISRSTTQIKIKAKNKVVTDTYAHHLKEIRKNHIKTRFDLML